ncbi:saccharopine dehydrogenase NADP-binding domain-containing protein [Erwiniaceae bacterium BAC15a-03b]|uniref:Saccharopine dehydrogenase NADP-binding domain-containing protein n=1 Tax=Winslowiella arboricola TaxID=2978220 RepID=A0A9J6Q0B3_9GAMM|nr:saccharopine dehydrogenase NADP-binding domain-containing protein [Winslowiella arboricola]MCU5775455.1 saccharopine dehydrogenase NADP-binding domain-containing protein [Winslowiella arboricola]MCU5779695.1 saccharopine dehydrogenase NADP-binding domain-containing protein [Winslowiella arboricola]
MSRLMIYGASGYTGRMAAERAQAAGLDTILAGRDVQKLAALSAELGAEYRAFALDNHRDVAEALNDVAVVLNFAGPFAHTAEPLMLACIETGAHYLDITAEINVYRLAQYLGEEAAAANVMLLPGVGWDVVPTDCLAMQLARLVEQPQSLRIALQVSGSMSRGSAVSAGEIIGAGLLSRVDGELVATPDAQPARFDFGNGAVDCYPLSFGDLVTAWRSTAIANIAMFVHVTGDAFPEGDLSLLPDGPSAAERDAHRAFAVAEVSGADGSIARAVIETVNGYSFTPLAAVEAARRVLAGEHRPGFETPARLFGDGFAETIPGTRVTLL